MTFNFRGLVKLPALHAMVLAGFGFAGFGLPNLNAQSADTSGNGLLKGTFAFRHVAVQAVDTNYNPTEVTASYGTIIFDGLGDYSVNGTVVDNTANPVSQPLNVTGMYAIGSNGTGFIANPLYPNDNFDLIIGAVSQGVFTGSSTESYGEQYVLNDIFVAIPLGPNLANALFKTAYQTGVLDFAGGDSSAIKNALFELTPNGSGGFGTISLSGQASNQTSTSLSQSISGATYNFNSDGSASLSVPLPSGVSLTNALFTGNKTMFQSADGNFILGWTASGYDIFFGVKALTVPATITTAQGLYFNAGLQDSIHDFGTDSYYGSLSLTGDSNGDGISHQRSNAVGPAFDFGSADYITLNPDGTTTGGDFIGYVYGFGVGGAAYVGMGTQGTFALVIGLHAATFAGPGVFLNPIGVVSSASYQPITASLALGELITLYGTGLSDVTQSTTGGEAFPTTLGGVSVTMDGFKCPIFYVSPTQLSVIVPFELAAVRSVYANIQVTNNGTTSNVVQMYYQDTAPGAFSQTQNGIGFAAAEHADSGQLLDTGNPALPGEYISFYMTGLGIVTPPVPGGAVGPTGPFSTVDVWTNDELTVQFNDYGTNSIGNQGVIQFAGLAPGLAGLYQVNVQVPSGVLTSDAIYVEFVTDEADVLEVQIPYGSGSGSAAQQDEHTQPRGVADRIKTIRTRTHKLSAYRPRVNNPVGRCAALGGFASSRDCNK
jgi:uncharacterized protein (TIGR03437 family)